MVWRDGRCMGKWGEPDSSSSLPSFFFYFIFILSVLPPFLLSWMDRSSRGGVYGMRIGVGCLPRCHGTGGVRGLFFFTYFFVACSLFLFYIMALMADELDGPDPARAEGGRGDYECIVQYQKEQHKFRVLVFIHAVWPSLRSDDWSLSLVLFSRCSQTRRAGRTRT